MLDISLYFRALADNKRLLMVRHLAQHDAMTVTELGTDLRMSQPLISWHLRRLRRAGIVETKRSGRQVFCSINRPALGRYEERVDLILGLAAAAESEAEDPSMEMTEAFTRATATLEEPVPTPVG